MKISYLSLAGVLLPVLSAMAITPDNEGLYRISNATELEEFAALVNGGQTNLNAVLTADIDMNGVIHAAIGNDANPYRGTWDGRFHKISYLSMVNEIGVNLALFGVIADGAKISNTIIDATCEFQGADKIAGFVGQAKSAVETTIEFTNLGFEGFVKATSTTGTCRAAGIAGPQNPNVSYIFKNCYNVGDVQIVPTGGSVGGIAVCAPRTQLINCFTTNTVKRNVTEAKPGGSNPATVGYILTDLGGEALASPGDWEFSALLVTSNSYYPNVVDKAVTWKTPYDLPTGANSNAYAFKINSEEWSPTGQLCWYLNNNTLRTTSTEAPCWGQNLDDGDPYPSFLPGKKVVSYEGGAFVNKGDVLPGLADLPEVPSGIISVENTSQTKAIYNMQGIKVSDMSRPGLYIQNGKKIIVK